MKKTVLYCLITATFFTCKSKEKSESAEFFERANYHFKKNELDKALGFFNEAIEKTPDFADAYNNRGVLFLKLDRPEEAQSDFEKAVAVDPDFDQAKYNLARLYSETGKTDQSNALFLEIRKVYKDSSDYHNYYGQNLVLMNKNTEALEALGRATELNPRNVEALTNTGYVYFLRNEPEVAKEYLERALKIRPGFGYALNNLAVIAEKENDLPRAIELAEKALESDPRSVIYLNNMTLFRFLNKETEKGREYLSRALKTDDFNPYTRRNEAIAGYLSGDYQKARNILTEIEDKNPEVDYVYYYLGLTALKLKEPGQACKYFNIGVKLNDGKSKDQLKHCK